jgi:hypothetical protein
LSGNIELFFSHCPFTIVAANYLLSPRTCCGVWNIKPISLCSVGLRCVLPNLQLHPATRIKMS